MPPKRKRSTAAAPPDEKEGDCCPVASTGDVELELSDDSPTVVSEDEYIPLAPRRASTALGKKPSKKKKSQETDSEEEESREPPVMTNSDYVPVPFKGRIGYACLNTYLRTANPPIFCSRTCRIDTILKQGKDGMKFVQDLGLQNARDLVKMIEWNERYGIKFLRISSEMFPFASHKTYGYDVSYAAPVLRQAGELAMKYGHRLTVHPGQFTQLGSPRKEVIEAAVKDLEYHSQLLRGLGLRGQADKDAVMILHMGGMFGDKGETLKRFEENYKRLSEDVKNRLVLENDDVIWSIHDLLPICQKLNIPLVLDYHHHNIIHDPSLRAGSLDVLPFLPAIRETWTRKGITQKQHYSEPCPGACTGREMRKHSPRVKILPPCPDDMDLMIEAKDKEQAVFELYRKYNIGPAFGDVIPHERADQNAPEKKSRRKKEGEEEEECQPKNLVPEEEVGMGGPERRVYWPQGKEEWLSPAKRVRKKNEGVELAVGEEVAEETPKTRRRRKAAVDVKEEAELEEEDGKPVKARRTRKTKAAVKLESTTVEADGSAKKPRGRKKLVAATETGEGAVVVEQPKKQSRRAAKAEAAKGLRAAPSNAPADAPTRRRSTRIQKTAPPTPSTTSHSSPLSELSSP